MFCATCGNEIIEGAKFCAGCGSPVNQIPAAQPASMAEEAVWEEAEDMSYAQPQMPVIPAMPQPPQAQQNPIVPQQAAQPQMPVDKRFIKQIKVKPLAGGKELGIGFLGSVMTQTPDGIVRFGNDPNEYYLTSIEWSGPAYQEVTKGKTKGRSRGLAGGGLIGAGVIGLAGSRSRGKVKSTSREEEIDSPCTVFLQHVATGMTFAMTFPCKTGTYNILRTFKTMAA